MIGQSAGKSLGYLLGVYLGDGHIRADGLFSMSSIDEDFIAAVKTAGRDIGVEIRSVGPNQDKRYPKSKPYYNAYGVGDRSAWLEMLAQTQCKQVIPSWVTDGCAEVKKSFIAGLMDSEGFVAKRNETRWTETNRNYHMGYKSCDVFIPEFIKIMESVGIRIGQVSQEKPRKEGYKVPTRFTIKMQSWVDSGCKFNIARKQSRVDEWASSPAYVNRARNPRLTPETIR